MRVLERNASDGVNPIILIQFGSLYLTRLNFSARFARQIVPPLLTNIFLRHCTVYLNCCFKIFIGKYFIVLKSTIASAIVYSR